MTVFVVRNGELVTKDPDAMLSVLEVEDGRPPHFVGSNEELEDIEEPLRVQSTPEMPEVNEDGEYDHDEQVLILDAVHAAGTADLRREIFQRYNITRQKVTAWARRHSEQNL